MKKWLLDYQKDALDTYFILAAKSPEVKVLTYKLNAIVVA